MVSSRVRLWGGLWLVAGLGYRVRINVRGGAASYSRPIEECRRSNYGVYFCMPTGN
jgi:hypothetical protein